MVKSVILLGDGMADYPIDSLSGKTPLEVAHSPNMDLIARSGTLGLFQSIPPGMPPGSDVATLSILGYDPQECYSGRGPLESASMGIKLGATDIAFRCNLVTFSKEAPRVMDDFTAGHIKSDEAAEIIGSLQQHFAQSSFSFYPGVGYRHLCVWHGGIASLKTTPPHDITGREIACYLPQGDGAETLLTLMHESRELLERHPVNEKRRSLGEKLVSSIWLWGQGGAPRIQPLTEKYSLKGAVISAVDLLNGTGTYAGLRVIRVAGATGYIDTNYQGKANAALQALESGDDFVLVHVEAPDEMGHEGNLKGKIKAIEDFDKLVVGTILEGLPDFGDYRVMVLSDHLTPIALKTHTADPTIFAAWSSATKKNRHPDLSFSESCAKQGGLLISPGHLLFEAFIHGRL